MLLNAAVFMTDQEGIQLNFQQGLSPTFENAGDTEIKGLELELRAEVRGVRRDPQAKSVATKLGACGAGIVAVHASKARSRGSASSRGSTRLAARNTRRCTSTIRST